MIVNYIGPLKDHSGYGEANRNTVAALDAAGVEVSATVVNYTRDPSNFGLFEEIIKKVTKNQSDGKIEILHTTPDEYARLMTPDRFHIGQFYWETSRVPASFVKGLNSMNEIWTGSQANKDAMQNSGVIVPIYVFPQATDTQRVFPEPYELDDFEGYKFYSIFEWTERKNPKALVRAFYDEFAGQDDVCLIIKSYFRDFTPGNKRMIRNEIKQIKSQYMNTKLPPIFFVPDLMDREQVMRLHATGDCFVSAHRGEGWGIPQVEAGLAGNPIISTNYGGVHEWLGKTAMLVKYDMVKVRGMGHSSDWYDQSQEWAEIDEKYLRRYMRDSYAKQKTARSLGRKGRALMREIFSFERVGNDMMLRLKEIQEGLK